MQRQARLGGAPARGPKTSERSLWRYRIVASRLERSDDKPPMVGGPARATFWLSERGDRSGRQADRQVSFGWGEEWNPNRPLHAMIDTPSTAPFGGRLGQKPWSPTALREG